MIRTLIVPACLLFGNGHSFLTGENNHNDLNGGTVQLYNHLYCPTGQKYQKDFLGTDWRDTRAWLERHCQDYARDNCLDAWKHERQNGCSDFGGLAAIGWVFDPFGWSSSSREDYQEACYIHDFCYETGREQKECDDEFWNNLLSLGLDQLRADTAWASVRDFGHNNWANSEKLCSVFIERSGHNSSHEELLH